MPQSWLLAPLVSQIWFQNLHGQLVEDRSACFAFEPLPVE